MPETPKQPDEQAAYRAMSDKDLIHEYGFECSISDRNGNAEEAKDSAKSIALLEEEILRRICNA